MTIDTKISLDTWFPKKYNLSNLEVLRLQIQNFAREVMAELKQMKELYLTNFNWDNIIKVVVQGEYCWWQVKSLICC